MIPNQIEITSDTQTMRDLLKEGIDFYHLTPAEHKDFFLVDTRLKKLLNPDILVKDHFPFRKGSTPQGRALRTDPAGDPVSQPVIHVREALESYNC